MMYLLDCAALVLFTVLITVVVGFFFALTLDA